MIHPKIDERADFCINYVLYTLFVYTAEEVAYNFLQNHCDMQFRQRLSNLFFACLQNHLYLNVSEYARSQPFLCPKIF